MSDEQAGKIFKRISNYHQENSEKIDTDEMTDLIFSMFENSFIRDKKKYETIKNTRSELGKLWGLAKARLAKQKLAKPSKSQKPLANLADSVSDSVSENDSDIKKENISDTIVSEEFHSLSPEKVSFWNSEINEVFEIVKEFNQGITDDKQDWKSRWFWKHLISKISTVNKVKDWTYTWQQYLRWVLMVVSKNQYHNHKISGVQKIYYNFAELVQIANSEYNRQEDTTVKSF